MFLGKGQLLIKIASTFVKNLKNLGYWEKMHLSENIICGLGKYLQSHNFRVCYVYAFKFVH